MHNEINSDNPAIDNVNPNNNLNKEGDKIMKSIKMFNFKENWNLVEPNLNEPEVLALLDKGMSEYAARKSDDNLPPWDRRNGIGPWEYSYSVQFEEEKAIELMNESPEWDRWNERYRFLSDFNNCDIGAAAQDPDNPKMKKLYERFVEEQLELLRTFLPEAGTYRWFRCLGADCELAPWQKALAKRVFPEYEWEILDMNCQDFPIVTDATVVGTAPDGSRVIFDLLKFEHYSAEEIMKGTKCANCNCAV